MNGEQPTLDEIRLLRLTQAYGAIGLAHGQVELLIGEDELQADLGIELYEFLHALGQPASAQAHRGRDPQHAGGAIFGLGQPRLDRLQLHQHVMRRAEQHLALLGQHEAARVAMKQRHADIMLQRADLPRDRRLRQMQRFGGMGERPSLRRSVKHA